MNRAGTTTHLRSGIGSTSTACGQHITHLHPRHDFRRKERHTPLAIAKDGTAPDCTRCRAHYRQRSPVATPAGATPLTPFDRAAHTRELARHPGASWRFQTGGSFAVESRGSTSTSERFDEVVVDDWLHVEMMDTRSAFVQVAGLCLWLKIGKDGAVITEVELRAEGTAGDELRRLLGNEAATSEP